MAELDYKYLSELVVRAKAGDSDAFAELYAATYQKQYLFSLRYLKDEHLAQDALQETYILALKNLIKLKDPNLIAAWLNQINFRVCYNMKRKQARYDSELTGCDDALAAHPSPHEENPENYIVKIESQEYIMNQVLNLPFTESQVIILKYYQNMKISEIAGLMEISQSSVKRHLNSGKTRLSTVLQQ